MRILLIYPNITDYPVDISYGLASISAKLKSDGHEIDLIDSTFGITQKAIRHKLLSFNPQLIGIPVASNDFEYCVKISTYVKFITPVPIICGGYHTTLDPDDVLKEPCFDIAVIGEGEYTFSEIAGRFSEDGEAADLSEITGIRYKKSGEIVANPLRCLNTQPDNLPFPDKDLFDYKRYVILNRGLGTFITSFGCPFKCTYCINKALIQKFGNENFVRFKSVEYLLEEIQQVVHRYKLREVEFYDDTFTLNRERLKNFCEDYPKKIGLPFYINSRVDTIHPEQYPMLKQAGCKRISFGIECGDDFIRNEVLKRNQSDEQIIKAFQLARSQGIQTLSYNMVGIPLETKESIQKTIELNRKCLPDFVAVSIFNAYKGTEVYEFCKEKGWLQNIRGRSYFQTSNLKHPNFSLRELKTIRDDFGYHVFKRRNLKRAFIDRIDKRLLKVRPYQQIRSFLIRKGFKKYL